ncbi:MAG TPA: hypothetical protein VFR79_01810 [Nitrospira sp.]|nr:hypothetical protein [Nitrospira sp.]
MGYLIAKLVAPISLLGLWNDVDSAKQQSALRKEDVRAVPKDVLELRRRHHLRQLAESEDGRKIQDVPNGIFGFSRCGVPSLSANRNHLSSLEIHKHDDGIVYYVGYTSEDHLNKYLTRQKNFHLSVYLRPVERAPLLFEIPVDFVFKCQQRAFEEENLFDLFVTAIPEYKE